MSLTLSTAARNAQLDAITTAIGASGLLRIYDGSRPAGPGTAVSTQTLLAELTLGSSAFGSASNGSMTANAITSDLSANASGTATWYRITTSGGTAVVDGKVGTSGADLNLNSVALSSGAAVSISSFTLSAPAGTAD